MDILIYILFSVILIFYIIFFRFKKKIQINNRIFNISKTVHYLTIGIILFDIIIHLFDFKLRGLWTIKIVMWLYLTSSFLIQFKTELLKSKFEKKYFKILLLSPSVLVISWIIPMLGALICYSFMLLFNTYSDKVIFDNNQYKLNYEEGFLKYDYEFDVYKKNFIFEHKIKSVLLNDLNFDKILKVNEQNNNLKIKFLYSKTKIKDTLIKLK